MIFLNEIVLLSQTELIFLSFQKSSFLFKKKTITAVYCAELHLKIQTIAAANFI